MANPLNIALKVTGLDQAKADLQSFATIGKRSFDSLEAEAKALSTTAATTDQALRGVANRVRSLIAQTDEGAGSNLKYRNALVDVNRALGQNFISSEQAAKATAALRAECERLANATKVVVSEIKTMETITTKSFSTIQTMAKSAAAAMEPTAQSAYDLAVAMRQLSAAADPAAEAQMKLLSGLTQVSAALEEKIISTEQAAKIEQYLTEQSQKSARAEAELENATRNAAAARAEASIQAANAQKAASQIAVTAISMQIQEMDRLRDRTVANRQLAASPATVARGSGPAEGSQELADLAAQMQGLAAAANPLGAANQQLVATFNAVDRAVQKTIIDETQAAEIKAHLTTVNNALVASLNKPSIAIEMASTLRVEYEKLTKATAAVVSEIKQMETITAKSFSTIGAEAKLAAAAIGPTAQSTYDLATAMKQLLEAADPAAAAQMHLLAGLTQVDSALQQNIISLQQAGQLTQYLEEQVINLTRAEAESENAARNAAAARAEASIKAANAQKAASLVTVAAMQSEIAKMQELKNKSFTQVVAGAPSGGRGPAAGTQGQADLATQMRGLVAKANPMGEANLDLQRTIVAVNRARAQTLIDDKEEAQIIAFLRTEHEKYIATLNKEAAAHKGATAGRNAATQSASKLTSGLTQLSFQLNDIGTSLASGASPFMVIAQQGGQIFQVFQMFPGLLTKVATLLANPFVLGAIAVTAVGAAFAFLINRAGEAEARLRTYNVVLKAISETSDTTAQDLEDVAKGLQHTGTSAEDAQKAVLAFARTPLINKGAAEEITNLARDISAATGRDFVQTTEDIAKAVATDTEAVIKLVSSLSGPNGLSIATSTAMKELARVGDVSGAARLGLKTLQDQFGGSFNASLSDGQKSINTIAAAWDNMLTKLQNTTVITAARDAVIGMLNGIAGAMATSPSEAIGALPPGAPSPYVPSSTTTRPGFRKLPNGELIRDPGSGALDTGAPSTGVVRPTEYASGLPSLTAANTLSKDIAGLNAELAARLDRYFQDFPDRYVRSASRVGAHPSEFNPSGIGLHNKDILGMGLATDVGGLNVYDPNLVKYGLRQNVRGDWRHVEPVEIPSASDATGAARMEAARRFNALYPTASTGAVSITAPAVPMGVGGALAPRSVTTPSELVAPGLTQDQLRILERGAKDQDMMTASLKAFGDATRENQIFLSAYNDKMIGVENTEFNRDKAMQSAIGTLQRHRVELQQQAGTERLTADLAMKTGLAFGQDEVAGYKAAAEATAILAGRQGNLADVGLILQTQATEAFVAGAKQIPVLKEQADASHRLAEAAKSGAGAEHAMGVENQITLATHDALKKAEATGNADLIARAKLLREVTAAQIKRNDADQQNLAIRQRINQRTDQRQLVTQQIGLVGQLPETIEAANARLTEQQKLIAANKTSSDDIWKASMANVEALNKANIALAEAQRQQQRIDDMYRQIGSTIESAIGNVIDGIFDPKKAMDWGKTVKDIAKQMFTGIATNFFTKPLIGDLLGLIGAAPTVTSQFGSLFGGGSTTSAGGTTTAGGSVINIGTLGSLASIGSATGLFKDLGISDAFKGVTGFFKEGIGGTFAHQGTVGTLTDAAGVTSNITGTVPGSLFGSTTFGSALMGVGAGFAGGTLLNSLLGGKSTGGMIGSGIGSLAGLALTPFLGPFGPILGGLLGGPLGGMFGNSKPSNQAAGANIDLAKFQIGGGFSGGNQQIDQQMAQMGQSLQGFLNLLKTTGGALSGNILVQQGVNTGITADSSLTGYSGRFSLGKDADVALKVIEQALVKSITGVSETMKTVLSQVGTDEDLSKAIAFANAYDDVKKAADASFKSLEDVSKQIGPFHTAMDEINILFGDMTTQATRFGLALDPINAALAEATKRLQGDFLTSLDKAMNEATDKGYINQVEDVINNYIASANEAGAIGQFDKATQDKLGALFSAQVNQILQGLTPEQLTDISTHTFTNFNDVIKVLDATAIATAGDIDSLADRLKNALKNIQDFIDQLAATPSATVSPESAILAGQQQYQDMLSKAQRGEIGALEGITDKAAQYIRDIQAYYGSSQQGADLTAQILKDLQGLVGTTDVTDPTIVTNDLLTDLTDIQKTSNDINTTNGTSITGGTTAVVASNATTAASIVAANDAATATLIDVNNKTAAENIKNNQDATAALIADANASTEATLAANEKTRLDLIAANNDSAKAITDQNTEDAQALIDNAKLGTTDIIAQGNLNSGALISSGDRTTAQILSSAAESAAQGTADALATSDAIVMQNEADKLALIASGETTTAAIIDQAKTAADDALTTAKASGESVSAWGAATVAAIEAYGTATASTIAAWAPLQITATENAGSGITESVAAWGGAVANSVDVYGDATVQAIAAWSPLIISQTLDTGNNIMAVIALWSEAIISQVTNSANAIVNADRDYANSQVTATIDGASSVVSQIANWVGTDINNTTALVNSLINMELTYTNSIIIATYGAASSIVTAEATYHSNTLLAIQAQQVNDTNWFSTMNNNLYAMYLNSEFANNQRADMISKLRDILSQLQLMAQTPYPNFYNTGGV